MSETIWREFADFLIAGTLLFGCVLGAWLLSSAAEALHRRHRRR